MENHYALVIFDINGTLEINDHSNEIYSFNSYFDVQLDGKFRKEFYDSLENIGRVNYNTKMTKDVLAKYFESTIPSLKRYNIDGFDLIDAMNTCQPCAEDKHVTQTLAILHYYGIEMKWLSDWWKDRQELDLKELNYLSYFSEGFGYDNYYPKPNPLALLRCFEGMDKKKVLFVGDSIKCDILCANLTGVDSVLFNQKNKRYDDSIAKPTYVITDMLDLLQIVIRK